MNLSNAGDTVKVGSTATWQHNVNSGTTPNAMIWLPGSTFLITGITTNQTGIFKSNITYGNIVWNNTAEANYYAFRNNLTATNVQGSFTVMSTGTTNKTFANASGTTAFPGGYYQTGGTVNFRETGNIADTLAVGSDFSVTGGTFNSNAGTGSSLLVRLTRVNKSLIYNQTGGTNTNWDVSGSYNLGANLPLVSAGFGMNVSGTLNTGTFAVSGPGNFTLTPGAFLSSGSPLGINGNITATGTNTFSTAANYIFNGIAAQVTGTMMPSTVNALTINNAADVTLSNATNVTTALTLAAGKLVLDSNNISASSVLNSSATRYVVTNGTGALKINNIGAGTNVFPVGSSATSYHPVIINNAGTADNFSVSVKNTFDNAPADPNKVVNRQWAISEDTPGGSNVTISLAWITADQAPGFNPASSSSIMYFNGTTWVLTPAVITGAGTTATPYVATASGFTSFGAFSVVNDVALPLSILSFNAGYVNTTLKVWWSTTSELNTVSFEVEKSVDGRIFTAIGSLAARNTSGSNSYDLTDANPLSGVTYYRLKMTDKDGSFRYSKVVVVNSRLKGVVAIYPNPATNLLSVTHGKANKNATVEVVAVDGRKMIAQKLTLDALQTTVDISKLSAGTYTLVITNGPEKANMKFVKQ